LDELKLNSTHPRNQPAGVSWLVSWMSSV